MKPETNDLAEELAHQQKMLRIVRERRRVLEVQAYDASLASFAIGGYGRAAPVEGERRDTVRRRGRALCASALGRARR